LLNIAFFVAFFLRSYKQASRMWPGQAMLVRATGSRELLQNFPQ